MSTHEPAAKDSNGFTPPPQEQAADHVRAWLLEKWFWMAFQADALDLVTPPKELLP